MVDKNKKNLGMVDVSTKETTKRIAIATSQLKLSKDAYNILIKKGSPKGDVFETAKIAAILAAKETPRIVPLCHPLALSKVKVDFKRDAKTYSVTTIVEVVCLGKTGVEMEALTAASAASLTIYDMMKWAGQNMVIAKTQLLQKSGGKSGDYKRR
jgi:cyclic pyranopterin phosphate synthase